MSEIKRVGVAHRWCAAASFGRIAFIGGHTARETRGLTVTEQTAEVLRLLDQTLAEIGCTKADILGAQIILSNMSMAAEMNEVWDAWVAPGHPPARACVGAELGKGLAVEITATAAVRNQEASLDGLV
ncbi:RidA family protein [Azospirillum sp. A26]|uniref:RidA family protein n=1 Tax=Azospirillum sp. A26 TaxID=3160607 RepID=UPI00366BC34E